MGEPKQDPDAESAPPTDADDQPSAGGRRPSRLSRLRSKIKDLQEEDPNVYPSW